MTLKEFKIILDRLEGYAFSEFAFNSINEPFTDATILEKLDMFIERDMAVRSVFFSSNWLIPKEHQIKTFAQLVAKALSRSSIGNFSINATVSGIDQNTYEIAQGGRELKDVVAPYRTLHFATAVEKVRLLISELSAVVRRGERVTVHLKGYSRDFNQDSYKNFWTSALESPSAPQSWIRRHVEAELNPGLTTFARSDAKSPNPSICQPKFLDEKIVVGPDGNIGLCCQEGARKVQLGSLLENSLLDIIAQKSYQDALAVTLGLKMPHKDDICLCCEWFRPLDNPT